MTISRKITIFHEKSRFHEISYLGGAHVLGVQPAYGGDHSVFGDDLKIEKKIQKLVTIQNLVNFLLHFDPLGLEPHLDPCFDQYLDPI